MVSVRLACRAFGISRTVYHYEPDATRDEPVIEAIQKLVDRYPRYGSANCFRSFVGRAIDGTTSAYTAYIAPLSTI